MRFSLHPWRVGGRFPRGEEGVKGGVKKNSDVFQKISNVLWKISDIFQKISDVFGSKSHVYAARSEVGRYCLKKYVSSSESYLVEWWEIRTFVANSLK